jgi:superfamily II DNA or RNA helicase
MAHLHQVIRPRFILGLSATPFRADRVKLCFDAVLKDAGIQSLIQDGFLSPYHHYTIPAYSPESVAECYVRDRQRWGKTLLYFHTLESCYQANRLLCKSGVACDVVTADSDREAQLADFRAGRIEVLCNCLLLAEGFDCPELKTVFCRPSCKSVTVQMAGRVLRKHPDLAAKQIVQCSRTRWPFSRTAAPALQFVWSSGDWRSLQANPCIQQVAGRALQALVHTQAELPVWISRRLPRSRRRIDRDRLPTEE